MLILDTTSVFKGNNFHIPSYHRGHLSLRSGTSVTACVLPSIEGTSMPVMSELVVSPIQFDSWRYLTKITATFNDRAGVVRKLAYAMQDLGLNILYEESAAIEAGRYHRCEIIVDASNQYAGYEQQLLMDRVVLSSIERRLKAICLNELVLDGKRPRLKVRPMEGLRNAWSQVNNTNNSNKLIERLTVNRGVLIMPSRILGGIQQKSPYRAIVLSDTRERILRILFPNEKTHFTYIRVVHNDAIGALSQITGKLAQAFNAVLTLTRLKAQRSRNDIELLLYSDQYPAQKDDPIKRSIAETLLSEKELVNLQIEVSYPTKAGQIGAQPKKPKAVKNLKWKPPAGLVDDEISIIKGKSSKSILESRIVSYRKQLSKESNSSKADGIKRRLGAAKYYLSQECDDQLPSPSIFISFDFTHDDLRKLIGENLQKHKCLVHDGTGPHGNDPFREIIKRRIQSSNGFVAIWKPRDDETFSPWLLWELGIAQAADLPFQIYVHNKVRNAPHIRINPEKHHLMFGDNDFDKKLAESIPEFLQTVAKQERAKYASKINMIGLEDEFGMDPL